MAAKKKAKARAKPKVLSPTVVNLRFSNEGRPMTTPKKNPAGTKKKKKRNPKVTFWQAILKVAGAGAAGVGTAVVTMYGASKLPPNSSKAWGYVIPVGAALVGAGIATKAPVVGLGVAVGALAPFGFPIVVSLLAPAQQTTQGLAGALRAVSMGGGPGYRELAQTNYPRPRGIGTVSMGTVHAH